MEVVSDSLLSEIVAMSGPELDELDLGVIEVDDTGIVKYFNQGETNFSGVTKEQATGRNFFTQIAPCTNNRLFYGRFKKGIKKESLDHTLPYTYTYKMKPTNVLIRLYRDPESKRNFIVTRLT